ncbi:MAG: hypothetical protein NXI31_02985 [bacterium]|nr:hypothetical protein [bacterium]
MPSSINPATPQGGDDEIRVRLPVTVQELATASGHSAAAIRELLDRLNVHVRTSFRVKIDRRNAWHDSQRCEFVPSDQLDDLALDLGRPIEIIDRDDPIRLRPPVTVTQFAATANRKVADILGILAFDLGAPGASRQSEVPGDVLELLGLELRRPIEFLDDTDA